MGNVEYQSSLLGFAFKTLFEWSEKTLVMRYSIPLLIRLFSHINKPVSCYPVLYNSACIRQELMCEP